MKSYNIAVVALLKQSQVKYKITPLLRSRLVNEVVLFRKERYTSDDPKLTQYVLPGYMHYKCFYWTLTPFFIAFKLRRHSINLLLTYRFIPHTCFTWVVSKLIGKPFIYSQIDLDVVNLHSNIAGKLLVERVLRDALQINVPGAVSYKYWRSVFNATPINILHSTINTDFFQPIEKDTIYDIMYVGVLTDLKQVGLLIQSVDLLTRMGQSVKFAIVGYGPLENSLKALVCDRSLSESVVFLGKREVNPQLLCSAKLFTMVSRSEGLPCALMEAMACERLCITTDVGNISDVIIDGVTGYFFTSLLVDEIADQILQLLACYSHQEKIRKSAREHIVANHSFTSAIRKWDAILPEIEG